MLDIKLLELLPIQKEVNKVVIERLGRDIAPEEFILALNIEFFEFFNRVGVWKWWKQSHKLDREKILDELADCFAFFLSIVELADREKLVEIAEGESIAAAYERDVRKVYEDLQFIKNENQNPLEHVRNLILIVGTDNETESLTTSIHRFAISIYIVELLFEGITWEEILEAYKIKSGVNIQRQETNY